MESATFINANTGEAATSKALQYSEKPEELKKLLDELTIEYRFDGIRKYFPEDKQTRQCLEIRVTRKGRKPVTFNYGMSINDTETLTAKPHNWDQSARFKSRFDVTKQQKDVTDGLLYDILTVCHSEYHCPKSFQDFCSEYGYDEDSRKAESTHRACLEQSAKLERIFTEDEAATLPD